MTVEEALNLEPEQLQRLTEKELRRVLSPLISAGNKRIKRLEEANLNTPALRYIKRNSEKFSQSNSMNINQLRAEYSRVSGFLRARTSTKMGARAVKRETEKRIGGKLDDSQMDILWEAYHRLGEDRAAMLNEKGVSTQLQQFLRSEIEQGNENIDNLFKNASDYLEREYERMTEPDMIDWWSDDGNGYEDF